MRARYDAAMPIHDWTRVDAGTWHDFHLSWLIEMRRALNGGVLPEGFYVQAERQASRYEADALMLEEASHEIMGDVEPKGGDEGGAVATLAPPRLSVSREVGEEAAYAAKRRTLAVRHQSGDRVVALIELTSPGNKDRFATVEAFVDKAIDAMAAGVHVGVVDLFPPRRHDAPGGLAGAVAEEAKFGPLEPPAGKALWIAAYEAGPAPRLWAEPLAVGDALPELPLFLAHDRYVNVPLESTYAAAFEATPRRWRDVLTK